MNATTWTTTPLRLANEQRIRSLVLRWFYQGVSSEAILARIRSLPGEKPSDVAVLNVILEAQWQGLCAA